jgi:hypothetical protein
MNLLCVVLGCVNRATSPGFSDRWKKHGGRYRCSYPDCTNIAQGRGRCVRHGYKKKTCEIGGCTKQCVVGGCCNKEHGLLTRCCVIGHCTKSVFRKKNVLLPLGVESFFIVKGERCDGDRSG